MKIFKRKLLPILLTCMLLLAAVPTAIFAAAEPTVVSSEKELIEAVDAVKQGGTGEITLASNMGLQINDTLNIEGKCVVLNLNGSHINTVNKTVFNVVNGNLTINVGESGSIRVADENYESGDTKGMGIISISGKSSTLIINGGSYTTSEEDNAFVVSSGAKAVISGAYVGGILKAVGTDDDPAGEIVINSGVFDTDVSAFVKDKWCGEANGYWYVREKEYSDEFTKLFPDNKLVINSVPPANEDELFNVALILVNEYMEKYGVWLFPDLDSFNDDYSKCEVAFVGADGLEEIHTLNLFRNYDSATYEKAKALIENFPEDIEFFNVTDLELINYFVNSDPDSEDTVDSLANYSGQLKGYLKNSNFSFDIDVWEGSDDTFVTERTGIAKLTYNGTVYYVNPFLGAKGEHAICVPSSTGDTAEELLAAAQKRVDDYIGEDRVKITLGQMTVTEYRSSNPEEDSRFEEGGDLYFMNKAAGGYLFDVKIGEETYQFVVVKDDAKLAVPTYTSVDLGTLVEVKTDSSEVPLDTAVTVEKLTSGEEYNRIIKAIGTENGEVFEITLYSASLDKNITKLENGKFEVKLPIPEKLQNKNLIVYYVDSENKVTEHEVTVKDGFASFTTDHFSIYTLAEKVTAATEKPKQEETKQEETRNTETKTETNTEPLPKAGDNSSITLLLALAFVSACILFGTNKVLKKSRKS